MRELTINGKPEGVFLLNLGLPGDTEIWERLKAASPLNVTTEFGGWDVVDVQGVGRSVRLQDTDQMLLQSHLSFAELMGNCCPSVCPFCGSGNVRHVTAIAVVGVLEDKEYRGNSGSTGWLEEYQCLGGCEGRRFWI